MKKLLYFAFFCIFAFFTGAIADTITINWLNTDKTINQTTTCNIGGDLILPDAPTKPGYDFVGWAALGYTPIEYLESTGTQYINTDIQQDLTNNIVWQTYLEKTAGDNGFMGGNAYTQFSMSAIAIGIKNKIRISWTPTTSTECTKINNDGANCKIWNVNANGIHICLFALGTNTTGSAGYFTKTKIYSSQIYVNNTLVRDFIPVLDSNGIPCMFDKVTNQFFYNAGTGDFIAGPAISE